MYIVYYMYTHLHYVFSMYVYIYVCIQYTLHFSNVYVPMSGTKIDHEFTYQTWPTTCPSCWCSVSRDHSRDLFIRTGPRHYSRWHWSPQAQCFKLHHIQQHWRGQHHIYPLRVDNIRPFDKHLQASARVVLFCLCRMSWTSRNRNHFLGVIEKQWKFTTKIAAYDYCRRSKSSVLSPLHSRWRRLKAFLQQVL